MVVNIDVMFVLVTSGRNTNKLPTRKKKGVLSNVSHLTSSLIIVISSDYCKEICGNMTKPDFKLCLIEFAKEATIQSPGGGGGCSGELSFQPGSAAR